MILSAGRVVELQHFLMDAAKRRLVRADATAELLTQAAALDYALLLSSEHGTEPIDDAAPVATTIRETMARAAAAALDVMEAALGAPEAVFAAFA
jgi:hypothetical protein